jgi:hypothetical protein
MCKQIPPPQVSSLKVKDCFCRKNREGLVGIELKATSPS